MSYVKRYISKISLGYKYNRIYIKIRKLLREPLFQAYSYMVFVGVCLFLSYVVYNGVIRERLPSDLLNPISNIQLSIYGYILFLNIMLFTLLLAMQIKAYWGNPRHQGFFAQTAEKINDFLAVNIFVPIIDTYLRLIYSTIRLPYERFLIAIFIVFNDLPTIIRIVYFFGMLIVPKCIVLTCFLWDIFYNQQFYYFYKVIWLLLLPLWLKFSYGTFRYLYVYAPDRIMTEMNESSEAPTVNELTEFQNGSPLSLRVQSELELSDPMDYVQQKRSNRWYIRLYYRIKADLSKFKYNIAPKTTADALYTYNLCTYLILKSLRSTILVFDSIKKDTYFYLNFVIRVGYIIGWSTVILKQGPFPLTEYYLELTLSYFNTSLMSMLFYGICN